MRNVVRAIALVVVFGTGVAVATGRVGELYGTCHVAVAGTSATVTFAGVLGPRQCHKMMAEGGGRIMELPTEPIGERACFFDARLESIEVRVKPADREVADRFCSDLRTQFGTSKLWKEG